MSRISPKEYKNEYFKVLEQVADKMLRILGENLKNNTLTAKQMHSIKEACESYHLVANPRLENFRDIMTRVGIREYNEIEVIALLRYYNGKYPALTLRNMYKVHDLYPQLCEGARKLSSGNFDKNQFNGEEIADGLIQYKIGNLYFTVPKTESAKKEVLDAAMMWLNEKKAKSFEFIEVDTMVAVHGG